MFKYYIKYKLGNVLFVVSLLHWVNNSGSPVLI